MLSQLGDEQCLERLFDGQVAKEQRVGVVGLFHQVVGYLPL